MAIRRELRAVPQLIRNVSITAQYGLNQPSVTRGGQRTETKKGTWDNPKVPFITDQQILVFSSHDNAN